MKTTNSKQIEPLLLDAKQSADLIGVSRAHLYSMHSSGRLGPMPVRLGRRTLWRRESLEKWCAMGCPAREKYLELMKCSA